MSNDGAFSETVLLLIMPVGVTLGLCVHILIKQSSPMIRMPAEIQVVEVSDLFTDSLYQ